MNFKRLCAAVLAALVLTTTFVYADSGDKIELVFTDVTATDTTTLKGESKIKVSVKGATGTATIVQTDLSFTSNDGVKYKSIQYLIGENNPPSCTQISPNVSSVNRTGSMLPSIISIDDSVKLEGTTDLFVLTFTGLPERSVTLKGSSVGRTYIMMDGKELTLKEDVNITATTSNGDNEGINTVVKVVMDKVTDFNTAGSANSGIEVSVTSETTGHKISTVLSEAQRDNRATEPTFVFNNTLVDDTYTVEVSGIGYVTYKKSGVTFDETLIIKNDEFIPGDISCDGVVDDSDEALYNQYIENNEYSDAADFNRDGAVDEYDNIFEVEEDDDDDEGGSAGGGGGAGAPMIPSTPTTPTVPTTPATPATPVTPEKPEEVFTDLGNHLWAKDAVYELKSKGIISGISATEYAPASNIKRGDFILILSRMLKLENTFEENFADVPADSYYFEAIGKAKAAGIATGDGVNFMPENTITRQDLITLAYRAFLNAGYIKETSDFTSLDQFDDKDSISDYATAPMASMVASGIIKGADGGVNPKGFATRAEVAVMCQRLLALMK